tara:strand:+ start:1699 stop:2169 length:471 start_codon:yes stop_codon:yes gene_type:complete
MKTSLITQHKYLNCLFDLQTKLNESTKISMAIFIKENKLSASFSGTLQKGGIIKKVSHNHYEWCSIKPNISMVRELLNRMAESRRNLEVKTITKSPIKEIKDATIKIDCPKQIKMKKTVDLNSSKHNLYVKTTDYVITISLLWGLFKYNKKTQRKL